MRSSTRNRFAAKQPAQAPQTDSAGRVFDPSRHVAPDALTKAGNFRLKPGKSHA